jgi:hypothetical protein
MYTLFLLIFGCYEKNNGSNIPSSTQVTDTNTQSQDTSQDTDTGPTTDTANNDSGDITDTGQEDTSDPDTGVSPTAVSNFALPNINPESETFGNTYSPRDFIHSVSGWYFIKGT